MLFIAVILSGVGGCQPKSPAPPETLEQLRAFVESDGRQTPAVDVFSMPGSFAPDRSAVDLVKVSSIDYEGSPGRISREVKDAPAGTTLYYYGVKDARMKSNGAKQVEDRLFLLYQDAAGAWRFAETKRPDYQ